MTETSDSPSDPVATSTVVASPLQAAPQMAPLNGWARFKAWLNTLFVDHAIFRFFFNVRKEIAPGVYRSSHPMPYQLRAAARAGVKTVINLRGSGSNLGSNQLEWDAAQHCGLKVFHFAIGSRDVPEPAKVLGLARAFEQVEYPLWFHCKSGADRAGFAATLYQLLRGGKSLLEARRELSLWRHGHVRQAKTGILDHFFDCYAEAHARTGIGFLDWVCTDYDREAVRRSFHEQWWASVVVDRILRRE